MSRKQHEAFTQDEVTAIIRRALLMHDVSDSISQADLEDIAQQTGITRERLERAIMEEQRERDLEKATQRIITRKRQGFNAHLRAWLIVSTGWFLINLMAVLSDQLREDFALLTCFGPILLWGMAVGLHASNAWYPTGEKLEKEARRLLWHEQELMARVEQCKDAALNWFERALGLKGSGHNNWPQ